MDDKQPKDLDVGSHKISGKADKPHADKQPMWMERLFASALKMFSGIPLHQARREARNFVQGSSKHGRAVTKPRDWEHKRKVRRQMAKASRRINRQA
jgi:hypothetical protein